MIKDVANSIEDIAFQAMVGKETGGMFLHLDGPGVGNLDFSPASIEAFGRALDAVLADIQRVANPSFIQRFLRWVLQTQPDTGIDEECEIYGCYLGEVLVRHHGWGWERDTGRGYLLRRAGDEVMPDHVVRDHLSGSGPRVEERYQSLT